MTEGISIIDTTGYYLYIGDVILEITGETIPCKHMDEAFQGLKDTLTPSWRGGITCKVIKEGTIRLGTHVTRRSIV